MIGAPDDLWPRRGRRSSTGHPPSLATLCRDHSNRWEAGIALGGCRVRSPVLEQVWPRSWAGDPGRDADPGQAASHTGNGLVATVTTVADRDIDQASALWGYPSKGESRWWAAAAVAAALALQIRLPEKLTIGPRLLLPGLEVALMVPLLILNPSRLSPSSRDTRWLSITLIAVINGDNMVSLALLIRRLLHGGQINGRPLIYSAISIWATGVLVFGLWYWEIDRGGPIRRCGPDHGAPDFLFPQMENPAVTREPWSPGFIDYMYLSLTNSMAFSPTDVLPLTRQAKAIMAAQSLASLATIAVVGARAVNILN